MREDDAAREMEWEMGREKWELQRRWRDKDSRLGDKASVEALFHVGKGEGRREEGGGGKQVDRQTGRKTAVLPVGVGSVLWTQLSDSAFRAGRPERGGQGDRQPEQHNKDAVRKRGGEKNHR